MYEEAFPIFQRLTRINPVHEDGLCKLGGLYYKQQMHEEAFIIFQRLTRISPTNTEYQGVMEAIQNYISEFKNKKISKKEKKKKEGKRPKNKR
jgi:tetratricopeptide (TPR) repeat protein